MAKNSVNKTVGLKKGNPGNKGGSGRPKKEITKLREMSFDKRNEEAEKSLDLIIQFRNDISQDPKFRRDCANDIMDRIWGRPKQAMEHTGKDGKDLQGVIFLPPQSAGETGKMVSD